MKRVSVLGATGSIGVNTLDLITRAPEAYRVIALTGGRNVALLAEQARATRAEWAVTAFPEMHGALSEALAGTETQVASGPEAIAEAASRPADWVMSAIVGAAGLEPSLAAARQGTTLALANKESLVCAGPLLLETAAAHGTTIVPVDSEHSAIFQALIGEDRAAVERVIITASGGAFRDWPLEKLAEATPEQASTHPNWAMGQRITVDSASMFNKAMELIEAKEFFALEPSQIEVVVHPESLIHGMVGFSDGGIMAHVGPHDMRHAIGFALHWPKRQPVPVERLDFVALGQMTFRPPDTTRWPALALAREVLETGGLSGAVFNAAKEAALDAFLARKIRFTDMVPLVENALNQFAREDALKCDRISLDSVTAADHLARARVGALANSNDD